MCYYMQKVDRIMEYDFLITILISIVNLSSFLYMYFFPKLSMELKHKKIRGIYVVFVILFMIYNLYELTYYQVYSIELEYSILGCLMFIMLKGNVFKKIYYIIFSYVMTQLAESIYIFINNIIFQFIFPCDDDYLILLELLKPIILVVAYKLFKKYKMDDDHMDNKEWFLFMIMAIFAAGFFEYSVFATWNIDLNDPLQYVIFNYVYTLFMVLMYMLFYFYLRAMGKKNKILFETERRLQTEEFNIKLHKQMEEANEQNRKLRHDLKNHMLMIKNKIDHDPQEANEYIEQLLGNVNNTTIIDGKNEALIYILNSKNAIMQEKGISVKFILQSDLDIISEYDLTVIFGNLLDNAIEAQEHVEDKRIIVEIREDKDFYYIRIKNHYDPARIIKTNEVFKTSKENKEQHGYGLKNVEECVKRYHGIFKQETDDYYFISMISIPK